MTATRSGDLARGHLAAVARAGERFTTTALARAAAVGELRREVESFAQRVGACDIALEGVALAVSEALTNVVVHAYAGRLEP